MVLVECHLASPPFVAAVGSAWIGHAEAKVSLSDRNGKVLYENPAYLFREQYEVSQDLGSFFEEDSPAFRRLSQDFARTLVSDILEGF